MHSIQKNSRLDFLDVLRLFAITPVLICHLFQSDILYFFNNSSGLARKLIWSFYWFINEGVVGVVIFFLVSGYIITKVLENESSASFFIRRIFRIYPLYIAALLLDRLLWPDPSLADYIRSPDFWQHALLIGDFFGTWYSLGGVEWTLRMEVTFYALMGCYKIFCEKNSKNIYAYLAWMLLFCTVLLSVFKHRAPGFNEQVVAYYPFLFLGAFFRIFETGNIRAASLCLYAIMVILLFYFPPEGLPSYFDAGGYIKPMHNFNALLSIFLFVIFWIFRYRVNSGYFILLVSGITYEIYLFHIIIFKGLSEAISIYFDSLWAVKLISLFSIFLFCIIMKKFLGDPAIKLGKELSGIFSK